MSYNILNPNNDINRSYNFLTKYIVTIASGVLKITTVEKATKLDDDKVETSEVSTSTTKFAIPAKDVYVVLSTMSSNFDYKASATETLAISVHNKYNKHIMFTLTAISLDSTSSGYNADMNAYFNYLSSNLYI